MKKCKNCVDITVCDFCKYYRFNPGKDGEYLGAGYCKKHKKRMDPAEGEDCWDFYCSMHLTLIDKIKSFIWYWLSIRVDK